MAREPTKLEELRDRVKNNRVLLAKARSDADPAFVTRAEETYNRAVRDATRALADARFDHAEAKRRVDALSTAVARAEADLFEHENRAKIEQLKRLAAQARSLGIKLEDLR